MESQAKISVAASRSRASAITHRAVSQFPMRSLILPHPTDDWVAWDLARAPRIPEREPELSRDWIQKVTSKPSWICRGGAPTRLAVIRPNAVAFGLKRATRYSVPSAWSPYPDIGNAKTAITESGNMSTESRHARGRVQAITIYDSWTARASGPLTFLPRAPRPDGIFIPAKATSAPLLPRWSPFMSFSWTGANAAEYIRD
jgi:hypothetical protein